MCPKLMDRITKARRSWNMSRIRSKDTEPERIVRSMLHKMGYRFRLHRKDLPGCPDVVLPRHKTVIFVHGCYWHRHTDCRFAYTPKSRVDFWIRKFSENVERDCRHKEALNQLGWRIGIIWECETADKSLLARRIKSIFRRTTTS